MSGLSSVKGLSLAEAIMSVFLVMAGFMLTTRMFVSSTQYGVQAENRHRAAFLAERKLESVRVWSRHNHRPAGTVDFNDWSSQISSDVPDPDFPAFLVSVAVTNPGICNPCSRFESRFPGQERRWTESNRQVTVTVRWSGGQSQLSSLLGAPPANWPVSAVPSVEISPTGSTGPGPQNLAQGASLTYSARLLDPSGHPVPDVVVRWRVRGTGNGTLTQVQRHLNEVRFKNEVMVGSPPVAQYTSGEVCQLEAYAYYQGRTYTQTTPDVTTL